MLAQETAQTLVLTAKLDWLLEELVADLDLKYGSGAVTVAAYDTAWVARVRQPNQPEQLAFPAALKWLLDNQAAGGNWGERYPYTLLPTLAGLLALVTTPQSTSQTQVAIVKARRYLQTALANWTVQGYEICGFEVLAPAMLNELEQYNITFDFAARTELMPLYKQKLAVAGNELMYRGYSNLLYSLEAFGYGLDWQRLKPYQSTTGGYGCSPAATAAALIYNQDWDSVGYNWLKRLSATYDGAVPNTYPLDCFEIAWVLNNLSYSPLGLGSLPSPLVQQLMHWLQLCLTTSGTGCSLTGGCRPMLIAPVL